MLTTIRGQVSGFQQRYEPVQGGTLTVWDFRVDRHDEDGQPLPRVAVQMRGRSFDGGLNVGDWVEVEGDWAPGKTLKVNHVRNLSTNADIVVQGLFGDSGPGKALRVTLAVLIMSLAIGIIGFVLISIIFS